MVYTFSTSGLLYRSNKLMFDRQTHSLWSNLTGEAVVGPLAVKSIRLKMLPMTLTSWGEWQKAHPETTVVRLDDRLGRNWGYDYRPGAADRARAGVSFPIWLKNKSLEQKEEVYTLRIGEKAKAYPMNILLKERLVNDRLGDVALVLIADPESGTVRAYNRNGYTFSIDSTGGIRDEKGIQWIVTEEALKLDWGHAGLERIPGHVSLWFAWYGFFPHTEIYKPSKQ